MISVQVEVILGRLKYLQNDDLIVLTDELVAERQRRGLYRKTYAAGYFSTYQTEQRKERRIRNGPNKKLRQFRKSRGMSQTQFGEMLGISATRVCDYETGASKTPDWVTETIERWEADGTL